MKAFLARLKFLFVVCLMTVVCSFGMNIMVAFADEAVAPAVPGFMEQLGAYLAPLVLGFVSQNPIAATVMLVLMVVRAVNKPMFAIAHAIVAATATKSDDEFVAKVEASKAYKAFCWFLDYVFSIKMGTQKPEPKKEA